jgi:hypothetical protein
MPTATLYPVHLQYCLRRMHAGDSATEEELLRAAGNRLERLARRTLCTLPNVRLCANTSDVFQEAVLRLLGSLPQHKQHRNLCVTFEAWRPPIRRDLLDLARRCGAAKRREDVV